MESFESVEKSLKTHLPDDEYNQVRRILYGKDCKELNLVEAEKMAAENNFEFKAYSMVDNTSQEQNRARNLVKIGLIQVLKHFFEFFIKLNLEYNSRRNNGTGSSAICSDLGAN